MSQIKGGGNEEFKGIGIISNADVQGMSPDQWEILYNNIDQWQSKLELVVGVTRQIQQVWGEFHNLQMKKEQESLRRFEKVTQQRKEILQKQLDEGYINQKQYDAKVKQLEDEVDRRRKETAIKQARFERNNAIINAIIGTATAVIGALGNKPWTPANFVLAGVVGALGAAQTAMIASQPLPTGYAKGGPTSSLGFKDETGYEVAGIVHADEYVIPKWLRKQPEVARVEQWLEAKRTGRTEPFAEGGATTRSSGSDLPESSRNNDTSQEVNQLLYGALIRTSEIMEKLDRDGIRAYVVADERAGKDFKKSIEAYEILKNKNRK